MKQFGKSNLSRRNLIKWGAVAAGASSSPVQASLFGSKAPTMLATEEKDTIIIGSGFGGAMSAYRLTEAGHQVTMIERGRRWDGPVDGDRFSKSIYPDGRSTWLKNKTVIPLGPALPIPKNTGVLDGSVESGKSIVRGAAYGGGSIVYGGVLKKPEKKVFEEVFPKEVSFEELEKHWDEIGEKLLRSTLPEDLEQEKYWKHVRVMKEHCEKAGVKWEDMHTATDWDIVRKEVNGEIPGAIINGDAVYGVNSGAKTTLDNTYLKDAESTGLLEVKTLHRVIDLMETNDGRYRILFEVLGERGDILSRGNFICRKLILAAGTMGTSKLLVRAKAKGHLSKLNDEVGKGWGNNGNVYALRLGLTPTGSIHGGPPSAGIADYENPRGPMFIEHPQLPLGFEFGGLLYFGIGINPTRGHFYYDKDSDSVKLSYPKKDKGQENINEALLETLKKLNEANGGWTTSAINGFKEKVKDDAVYHPLGGCVLGKATDFYGRVKGYTGLYVNDGSFMPGASACTNPSFTISAIADRNIQKILGEDY